MSRYYRRVEKGRRTSLQAGLVAGGLATAVGAVSYYLVRLLLSREPLDPLPPKGPGADADHGETGRE